MTLEFKNISFSYPMNPDTVVLSDVSCTLNPGERIGIIGRTGSGKTTLIQLFSGILLPLSGTISIDGKVIDKLQAWSRFRRKIGLVLQFPEKQLFEETVFDDVAFGVRKYYNDKKEIHRLVFGALRQVGLDPKKVARRTPFNLSSGEKRRVALAGIIALQPDTLFLDEPTIGIDYKGILDFESLISNYNKQGRTVCFVSHNMDFVSRNADRVIALGDSTIQYDGPREGLFYNDDLMEHLHIDKPEIVVLCEELSRKFRKDYSGLFRLEHVIERLKSDGF